MLKSYQTMKNDISVFSLYYEIDRRDKGRREQKVERDFQKQETPASVWPLSRRQLDTFSE